MMRYLVMAGALLAAPAYPADVKISGIPEKAYAENARSVESIHVLLGGVKPPYSLRCVDGDGIVSAYADGRDRLTFVTSENALEALHFLEAAVRKKAPVTLEGECSRQRFRVKKIFRPGGKTINFSY